MKRKIHSCLLVGLFFVGSCASRPSIVVAPEPTKTTKVVRYEYLTESDSKRVRNPEFVKSYHVGRRPSKSGRLMHEAHRVYQIEKSPRWNLLRNNPALRSTGPIPALSDSAFRPLPRSNQLRAEHHRQGEITQALEEMRAETAQQLDAMKTRVGKQASNAEMMARLTEELKRERQARAALEAEMNASQATESDELHDNARSESLRRWGAEQSGR